MCHSVYPFVLSVPCTKWSLSASQPLIHHHHWALIETPVSYPIAALVMEILWLSGRVRPAFLLQCSVQDRESYLRASKVLAWLSMALRFQHT